MALDSKNNSSNGLNYGRNNHIAQHFEFLFQHLSSLFLYQKSDPYSQNFSNFISYLVHQGLPNLAIQIAWHLIQWLEFSKIKTLLIFFFFWHFLFFYSFGSLVGAYNYPTSDWVVQTNNQSQNPSKFFIGHHICTNW